MPNELKTYDVNRLQVIALAMVTELQIASGKFAPFNSPHEGYAVIKEELEELWEAVKRNDIRQACGEAVQLGAMAMRFLYDIKIKEAQDAAKD